MTDNGMQPTRKWTLAQSLELFWWKRYLRRKDVEGYLSWKRKYWEPVIAAVEAVRPIRPGMTVLDAGCGPAGIFMNLPQCDVDAVDPLVNRYEEDLPHFRRERYPTVRFHAVPMELYVSDRRYDIVFSTNAINHVSDIGRSYDTLVEVVKPGGLLVITVDAHNHPFFKRLFRAIPGDMLHPHQYDTEEYVEFLTRRGLTVLHTQVLWKDFFFRRILQIAERPDGPV